jgi:peptidoglycan/xylan/chitin deacetylase (PgdA/CDA1 family)
LSELRVALTFDAEHPSRTGGDPDSPARILDTLARADVQATFFVQGRWASAYPATAARIGRDGHLVGNHSNYHAPMTLLSADGIRADVQEAERRIAELAGVDPHPWFRCPFDDGADRPEVLAALGDLGYRNVSWDVDPGDWREDAVPVRIEAATLDGVRSLRGPAVVLLHTWPAATAEALPALLTRLRSEGATFITVAELRDGT